MQRPQEAAIASYSYAYIKFHQGESTVREREGSEEKKRQEKGKNLRLFGGRRKNMKGYWRGGGDGTISKRSIPIMVLMVLMMMMVMMRLGRMWVLITIAAWYRCGNNASMCFPVVSRMFAFHMLRQIGRVPAAVPAYSTHKRLFLGVRPFVILVLSSRGAALTAVRAHIWLVSSVGCHVVFELLLGAVRLAADSADELAVTGMN